MSEHTPVYEHCGYLSGALETDLLRATSQNVINTLRGYEFDSIAFQGMSGALVAPIVAVTLKKTLIMIRKPMDNTHSTFQVEGDAGSRSYIILDDFIHTGATMRTIVSQVNRFAPNAKCLGILQYRYCEDGLLSLDGFMSVFGGAQ